MIIYQLVTTASLARFKFDFHYLYNVLTNKMCWLHLIDQSGSVKAEKGSGLVEVDLEVKYLNLAIYVTGKNLSHSKQQKKQTFTHCGEYTIHVQ